MSPKITEHEEATAAIDIKALNKHLRPSKYTYLTTKRYFKSFIHFYMLHDELLCWMNILLPITTN